MTGPKVVESLRVGREEAARMLAVTTRTVARLISSGVLTPLNPPAERGKGRRVWLHRDEVRAFAYGGRRAAEAFRAEHPEIYRRLRRGA